jgi:hypothetical protein
LFCRLGEKRDVELLMDRVRKDSPKQEQKVPAVTDVNQNASVLTSKCKTDRRSFQRRQEGKSFAFFYGSCARILSQRSEHQSNRSLLFFESRGHSLSPSKKKFPRNPRQTKMLTGSQENFG